jgi:membrane-bound metal-dependent hydrolase YbcI (DUF457 family)
MDPVSHVVIGRALVASADGHHRFGPGAGTASVIGALAPDADLLFTGRGWDVYLRAHEIGTHSLAGALAIACCGGFLVHRLRRESRVGPLLFAASAGAVSHLVLDVLSGARIRLGWPFIQARIALPLVAMADPWLLAICVAGAMSLWIARRRMCVVARLVVAIAVAFLCVKGALLQRALTSPVLDPAAQRVVEARWGSLTEWDVFERSHGMLRAWRVDSRGAPAISLLSWPVGAESTLIRASLSLDTVRNFLRVYELGFPIEEAGFEGGDRTGVFWSDIRFCRRPHPAYGPISCSLWFGGIFGRDGRVLTQEVKMGGWAQSRAAPP